MSTKALSENELNGHAPKFIETCGKIKTIINATSRNEKKKRIKKKNDQICQKKYIPWAFSHHLTTYDFDFTKG